MFKKWELERLSHVILADEIDTFDRGGDCLYADDFKALNGEEPHDVTLESILIKIKRTLKTQVNKDNIFQFKKILNERMAQNG